jgi:hypothetical protein
LSYSALTTYLAFVRKKGPTMKRLAVNALHAFGDLNHELCKVVRRCLADWRDVTAQLARGRVHRVTDLKNRHRAVVDNSLLRSTNNRGYE